MVVRMDTLEQTVLTDVKQGFMAKTVMKFVLLIVKPVDIQLESALVLLAGWDLIVAQNVFNHTEKIVSTNAIKTASIKHVIDSTGVV